MSDAGTEVVAQRDKKHRSPAYPFISLRKAVERADEFYKQERRHSAPLSAAAQHWGYKEKSSGGLQTVSALKQFGLLADDGSGSDRRVKLTERAFKILLDEVENSPDRMSALKEAALTPKLYAQMYAMWGVELPSDETIRTFLRRDKGFNDDVLVSVIRGYKDTLKFSKLSKSDTLTVNGDDDHERSDELAPSISVGDYVQWTSQGADQFETPRRVWMVTPDGAFVMVEGSPTGIPVEQVTKVEPPAQTIHGAHIPSTLQMLAPGAAPGRILPVSIAREVSSLTEGEAVLQWPASLSAESVAELEDWLELVIRKLKRRYTSPEPKNEP